MLSEGFRNREDDNLLQFTSVPLFLATVEGTPKHGDTLVYQVYSIYNFIHIVQW